jgi:hypothetical protein
MRVLPIENSARGGFIPFFFIHRAAVLATCTVYAAAARAARGTRAAPGYL